MAFKSRFSCIVFDEEIRHTMRLCIKHSPEHQPLEEAVLRSRSQGLCDPLDYDLNDLRLRRPAS
jgi:hypothetical protein